MEEIKLFYNTSGSDTDENSPPKRAKKVRSKSRASIYTLTPLPTPPPELERIPSAPSSLKLDYGGRKRSFPHVDGNFPTLINIPISVTQGAKNILEALLGKASSLWPELRGMDDDIVVNFRRRESTSRSNAGSNIEIAKEYHISLSRTVPIRVHQIDTLVPMLRHKFQDQTRFWIEFGRWEVYVNDEGTRTFLGLEVVSAGLSEIRKQVSLVTDSFRLHGLPPFYEVPRPHISVAWCPGEVASDLQRVAEELNDLCGNSLEYGQGLVNVLWSHLFGKLECKIGQQTYPIWTATSSTHV